MNSWGPLKNKKGHEGDPINLMDGLIYTLNHRRMMAYIDAQRETIPIRWAELEEIYENRFEFDTPDWGTFIEPRDR